MPAGSFDSAAMMLVKEKSIMATFFKMLVMIPFHAAIRGFPTVYVFGTSDRVSTYSGTWFCHTKSTVVHFDSE